MLMVWIKKRSGFLFYYMINIKGFKMKYLLLLIPLLFACEKSEVSTRWEPPVCENVAWIDTIGQPADTIWLLVEMSGCSDGNIKYEYLTVHCKNRQMLDNDCNGFNGDKEMLERHYEKHK